MKITWDRAFTVGHEKIDSEHRKLFEIASKIEKYRKDAPKIIEIVKELIFYTKYHFANEEIFMASIEYEKLDEHKKIHKDIIDNLNKLIKEINKFSLDEIIDKLTIFVNKNIVEHILIEDKKFHHKRKTREELKSNFRWMSDYKVFNELIDKEHKVLFDIAIKALDYNNTDIKSHIRITVKELYDYMKTHFDHEEVFMKDINYPALEKHKKLHQNIIDEMNSFMKTLPTLKIVDFEKKLIEYMDIWLVNHILYEDRKVIRFNQK